MVDCTLVTCEGFRNLDPDDRILLAELRRRGVRVSVEVWSDFNVDWAASRLCLLRSVWDYHVAYAAFTAWIERADSVTAIRNSPELVRWNAHKSYIGQIARLGVPVVPTVWGCKGTALDLRSLADERGWPELVIKPALGAAAHNVLRVRNAGSSLDVGQAHVDGLTATQEVLVQPYLASVESYGERALMFFAQRYSHAVVKKPFDTVLEVSDERSALVEATSEEIDVASKALAAAPVGSLYARVDLMRDCDGSVLVNEVELIEPAMYLAVHGRATQRFADCIERELATLT